MQTKRERYPSWVRWIRRRLNTPPELTCIRCKRWEGVGPDFLCENCLVACETDTELAKDWIQEED